MSSDRFFVGYLPIRRALAIDIAAVSLGLIIGFALLALIIGLTRDDPGDGAPRWDWRNQTVQGVMSFQPYPLLHVNQGTERIPAGTTLMLTGGGKFGPSDGQLEGLDGNLTEASGVVLNRGDLMMLQIRGGRDGLKPVASDTPVPAVPDTEPLGRWRLAGEICDGKCTAGAMRPGRGIAHKACASLCIAGGVPPVFVSSQPVAGEEFLLIAGPDGGPIPDALYDHIASYVELEGEIERRGDLLILRVDPASVRVL